ncbi:MAG: HD domain-containing protein [Desulfurivibrionaceae bacterium]
MTADSEKSKGLMIKDISDNQVVQGTFLVREVSRSETKNGKPFLALTVMDASGEIAGRVWENADRYLESCRPGATVKIKAQAQSYRNVLQLKIDHLEECEIPAEEMAALIPATAGDIPTMAAELTSLAESIGNAHLRELTLAFINDRHIFTLFKKAPAAKYMHHACLGGLLEHTLGVARTAAAVSELYPTVDRSLLMAGAILHDIGKLIEFNYEVLPYDYSDRGRLVGHMVLGIEMIQEKINGIAGFPEESATHLKHLILAHHGRHEFGSPSLPMMLEAFVLNFLDDLDAKIDYLGGLSRKMEGEGYQWSEYQRNLERFLFLRQAGGERDLPARGGDPDDEIDPRQGSLFR